MALVSPASILAVGATSIFCLFLIHAKKFRPKLPKESSPAAGFSAFELHPTIAYCLHLFKYEMQTNEQTPHGFVQSVISLKLRIKKLSHTFVVEWIKC